MREGQEGDVDSKDVRKPVFQALLYFTYTDQLPEVKQEFLHVSARSNALCTMSLIIVSICPASVGKVAVIVFRMQTARQ